jgi:hypothetical protein
MRVLTAFVSAVALALLTTSGALAQKKPDFSGTWTLDPAAGPGAPSGDGRGGRGGGVNPLQQLVTQSAPQQLTLTQSANTLTISWTQDGRKTTETLTLDGSETKRPMSGATADGQPTAGSFSEKASWEADRIVVVERQNIGGFSVELRRVFSMDGDHLVIELTATVPQGGDPTVVRVVYKKG